MNDRLAQSSARNHAATITAAMPAASKEMMSVWFSAASSAIRYPVAAESAIRPGHNAARFSDSPAIDSHPLADLFPDQSGWAPGHDGDDNGEGKDILIGAGKGQQHGADRLQSGEQEAAEDRPINAAESADNGGGKADHAEIKTNAEVDLVVIETIHYAGECS